jgi:YHS domain-containing protein
MKTALAIFSAVILLAGCHERPDEATTTEPMMTIENTAAKVTPVEIPPMIDENAPPPPRTDTTTTGVHAAATDTGPMSRDEALLRKMELPFAPAIAMDPVDGNKVSINNTTPMLEYKKKLYYFYTPENRRAFKANPEQYLKGPMARY